MGFMQEKRVLVTGVRNKWSISWQCALSLHREGAQIAFSVRSDREKDDTLKLIQGTDLSQTPIFLCDATRPEEVERNIEEVGAYFDGKLDGLLHSMAFAKREDLSGEYLTTSQDGFALAMDVSVYTLIALAQAARPLMKAAGGGSIVTLTYLGSERVIPGYNVMGVCKAALESSVRYLAFDLGADNIRVNAVSAGPIKTLSAQGVAGFSGMLGQVAERSPLRRRIEAEEVGDAAAFLLSWLARGITGEVLYVDAGYNIMGL